LENMDRNSMSPEVNEFKKFIRKWYFLIILAGVVLFIVVVGGAMRSQAIEAAQKIVVSDSFSNCKVIEKQKTFVKVYNYSVDTSCGRFRLGPDNYTKVEKGVVYDFVTVTYPLVRPFITEFKVSAQ
jgi:hypothetical protein